MSRATIYGVAWQAIPYHPVARAAAITGQSEASVNTLISSGALRAMKLAGKTLVPTESIVEFLARARPWSPDHAKIGPAKRPRLMQEKKTA
jgi:Helix-turn-helix domain